MEVKELIENAMNAFNEKVKEDEKMAKELEALERTVVIRLSDDGTYSFRVSDKQAKDLKEGDAEGEIEILSDSQTIIALFNREMGPMKAMATKKLKINASIQDMLKMRKFF